MWKTLDSVFNTENSYATQLHQEYSPNLKHTTENKTKIKYFHVNVGDSKELGHEEL